MADISLNTRIVSKQLFLPMGELQYFSLTGTTITISSQSTTGLDNLVKAAPATALTAMSYEFDNGGANNGRLRYTGTVPKMFHCAITLSVSPTTNNDEFVCGFALNGVVDSYTKIIQKMGTTSDTQSSAIHQMFMMSQNDYFELYVGNLTAGRNITLKTLNMFAMGV